MFENDLHDVEPRRKFRSADAAHIIFTYITIVCSAILYWKNNDCVDYKFWNSWIFFGCLVWMTYLVMTLVVKFRNRGVRAFLDYLDYLYLVFHLAMQVWANYLYWSKNSHTICTGRWSYWLLIYVIFGYIAGFCFVCYLFMMLMKMANKNRFSGEKYQTHTNLDYSQNEDTYHN
jgi:hypothetical protein